MRIEITTNHVRIPKHPEAVKGHVAKGMKIDVDDKLARRLVAHKRARYLDDSDVPSGPVKTIEGGAARKKTSSANQPTLG